MPHRASSPAISEVEYDISGALVNGDPDFPSNVSRGASKAEEVAEEIVGSLIDPSAADQGDEEFIAAHQNASNRKTSNVKGRSVKKGGGFQAMGLNANLLKAITRKGFTVPTPIQRKTIPLVLDGQDVVGMARTGSGKTAAFVVPMVQHLKAHSAKVGARALIMSPSRELALQTLKVVKELGRGTDLRSVLVVGGDSLEDQFASIASNPDIVIATPGRFLHLQVEMSLDLSSIRYVVFDEADRLFEMGFAAQLAEILHALPSARQTLLFSATLPKSLVEFARAGLQEPRLVRLDAESKVSPDLQSAFFTVKAAEKEGALLHLLSDVIKIPVGAPVSTEAEQQGRKRKRGVGKIEEKTGPSPHSTIIFAATKHHVDYLAALLRTAGFAVSHAYGALDQTARRTQVQNFRSGVTHILVVTDVAARGIDIPILANVINYDFPAQPKIFVHRVGRTARAGQRGWSYSLIRENDAPYLLDLQLFLGRKLVLSESSAVDVDFAQDVVVGALQRDELERSCEAVGKFVEEEIDLASLQSVASKGEKLYHRTRNSASSESAKRAKAMVGSPGWVGLHPLFAAQADRLQIERAAMLARVSGFRPSETIFEVGKRGSGEAADIMRKRRKQVQMRTTSGQIGPIEARGDEMQESQPEKDSRIKAAPSISKGESADTSSSPDDEWEVASSRDDEGEDRLGSAWQDAEHFMSYTPSMTNVAEDRGYGVHSGATGRASEPSNFLRAAQGVSMELGNDEGAKAFAEPSRARGMRWDKKQKKYVARSNDEDGSKGTRYIKGESGQKIAASFRSGRFEAWRKSRKVDRLPRIGEQESASQSQPGPATRYRHRQAQAPKDADKYRDDYHVRKKRVEEAKEKRVGKYGQGSGKNELRGVDDIRKQRAVKAKRREKNARPTRQRSR